MKKTEITSFIPPDKSSLIRQILFSILTEDVVEVFYDDDLPQDIQSAFSTVKMFLKNVEVVKGRAIITGKSQKPESEVFCGNSGTVMHVLMGISVLKGWDVEFLGDESLMGRDHSAFFKAAKLYEKGEFVRTTLEKESAQLKTFHLLAMLRNGGELSYKWKTRSSTEILLKEMGAEITDIKNVIKVEPVSEMNGYSKISEKDPSSAFIAACAALIFRKDVTINGVLDEDLRLVPFTVLKDAGYQISIMKDNEDVTVETGSQLKNGAEINICREKVAQVIDEIPFLAFMTARRGLTFSVEDAAWLRNKESDRISKTVELLSGFFKTEEKVDGFTVFSVKANLDRKLTHNSDHRIEMLASLVAADNDLDFIAGESVRVSFPQFQEMMNFIKR